MHFGYIGTGLKGSQINRDSADGETVEGILEDALLASGSISQSNYGNLSKLRWSRSSRTDKGVHSIASVVAFKMLVDPDSFDMDPEGIRYAELLNQHLPSSARVFSVQRVGRGFNARRACQSRRYLYYLPARLIGVGDGGSSQQQQQQLQLFQTALQRFVGFHAFHNYTKRKAYQTCSDRGAAPAQQQAAAAAATTSKLQQGIDCSSATAEAAAAPQVQARSFQLHATWLEQPDAGDRIGPSLYRWIHSWACEGPMLPSGGGCRPCLKLEVYGDSFMLHQIRHMIGAAVAVARGVWPMALLDASLAKPARCSVPLAPPHTLVLADSDFMPFRKPSSPSCPSVQFWTGPQLQLRAAGAQLQSQFLTQTLEAELARQAELDDWDSWLEHLSQFEFPDALLSPFLQRYQSYRDCKPGGQPPDAPCAGS